MPTECAVTKPSDSLALDLWLAKRGFKPLSSGTYATVYKNNKGVIIKAFSDDAYLDFVKACSKLQGNPYVPKFRGKPVKVFDEYHAGENHSTYVIRTEFLRHVPDGDSYLLRLYIAYYMQERYHSIRLDEIQLGDDIRDAKYEKDRKAAVKLYHSDDRLKAVLAALSKIIKHSADELYADLGAMNIMARGKQLVITDPLAKLG